MRNQLALITAAFLAAGCPGARPSDVTEAPPVIDQSTPDRLIETLWQYYTWESTHFAEDELSRSHPDHEAVSSEVQAHLRKALEDSVQVSAFREKNRILKVEVESPTRAVVVASEHFGPWSDEPEHVTYLLTMAENGWVVRDKTKVCWGCHGTGKTEDMEQRSSVPTLLEQNQLFS